MAVKLTVDMSGLDSIAGALKSYVDPKGINADKLAREVAVTLNAVILQRIHEDGIKADGSPIGTYKSSTIEQRMKHGFSGDSKVVFVWDRQMANDFSVGNTDPAKLPGGGYGLGFKNEINAIKAETLQNGMPAHTVPEHTRTSVKGKQYKVSSHSNKGWKGFGRVYALTNNEKQIAVDVATDVINRTIKNA